MDTDDYRAAYEGRVGADRMALRLPIIPDDLRGDMDEVKRLRLTLEYIARDVRCCSLDKATEAARLTLNNHT